MLSTITTTINEKPGRLVVSGGQDTIEVMVSPSGPGQPSMRISLKNDEAEMLQQLLRICRLAQRRAK